jgi:hypothetical protein
MLDWTTNVDDRSATPIVLLWDWVVCLSLILRSFGRSISIVEPIKIGYEEPITNCSLYVHTCSVWDAVWMLEHAVVTMD